MLVDMLEAARRIGTNPPGEVIRTSEGYLVQPVPTVELAQRVERVTSERATGDTDENGDPVMEDVAEVRMVEGEVDDRADSRLCAGSDD